MPLDYNWLIQCITNGVEDVTEYGIEIGLDDLEYIQEAERLGLCGGGF